MVGGIMLLANENFSWKRFAAAVLLGIVATYSFANGILFWPIGLIILFIVLAGRKERKVGIISWILASGLTFGFYFYHYQFPSGHPGFGIIFKMPVEYICFVFKHIGNICTQHVGGSNSANGNASLALAWRQSLLLFGQLGNFYVEKSPTSERCCRFSE
ncbi:MAG: hypothetical protein WDM76_01855 [Limisphaerales bacterium]